jgi:hypothetical protein
LGARNNLEKAMEFMASTRNKAAFYASCYLDSAVKEGKTEKKNKDFWKGLALFNKLQFDKAVPFFKKAAKTKEGKELVALLMKDRRLDDCDITVLGEIAGVDSTKQRKHQKRRIEGIQEFCQTYGIPL